MEEEESSFEEDPAVRTSSVKGMANYSPTSSSQSEQLNDDEDYIIPSKRRLG